MCLQTLQSTSTSVREDARAPPPPGAPFAAATLPPPPPPLPAPHSPERKAASSPRRRGPAAAPPSGCSSCPARTSRSLREREEGEPKPAVGGTRPPSASAARGPLLPGRPPGRDWTAGVPRGPELTQRDGDGEQRQEDGEHSGVGRPQLPSQRLQVRLQPPRHGQRTAHVAVPLPLPAPRPAGKSCREARGAGSHGSCSSWGGSPLRRRRERGGGPGPGPGLGLCGSDWPSK